MDSTSGLSKRDLALKIMILFNEYSQALTEELRRFVFERAELDVSNLMNIYGNLLHIVEKMNELWEDSSVNLPLFYEIKE